MFRAALITALTVGAGVDAAALDPGAPRGAVATLSRSVPYDRYEIPTGPFSAGTLATESLAGKIDWAAFRLDDPALSVAAVIEGYRSRLAAEGFAERFACAAEACGGFEFRFGVALLPAPAMQIDVADFGQLTLYRDSDGVWVSVLVSRVIDAVFVQTVSVEPGDGQVEITAAPSRAGASDPVLLPQDTRALLDRLRRDGHVAVDGLDFATGGTQLSPASGATLDMLAQLLSRDGDLSVVIVGHSDNQGGLDANIELSRRRAEAVRAALVTRGVPEGQMEARGAGYLAPVTTNATPEGRARNRRVELVLR